MQLVNNTYIAQIMTTPNNSSRKKSSTQFLNPYAESDVLECPASDELSSFNVTLRIKYSP